MKKRNLDHSWKIKSSELLLDESPEVLGRGTFGLVVKGKYRGTIVAVKRVLPAVLPLADVVPKVLVGSASQSLSTLLNLAGSNDQNAIIDESRSSLDTRSHRPPRTSANNMSLIQTGNRKRRTSNNLILETQNDEVGTSLNEIVIEGLGKIGTRGNESSALTASQRSDRLTSTKDLYEQFKKELQVIVYLRHPNITMVLGAVVEDEKEPLMLMEFMKHGSLYDCIHNSTVVFDASMVLNILRDVVAGMVYLHAASPPVLHNDIKTGNILVTDHFRAKLTDFGFSIKKARGMVGTPFWMAPELLRGEQPSVKTDVYSFGVMMFELMLREEPYEGQEPTDVLKLVADLSLIMEHRPVLPPLHEAFPQEIADLMRECWNKNPNRRPNFEEIAERIEDLDPAALENFLSSGPNCGLQLELSSRSKSVNMDRDLLHLVFPPHIADMLKSGQKVEPQEHECVTIFFSDIVGFTDISRNLQPLQVMNMLDRLYWELDALAEKHEVFKVETIGDAYMAVSNLIHPQPDHCRRICDFAIETVNAANRTRVLDDESEEIPAEIEEFVHLRVGFHSGPVVSSVVGNLNPRFCLFGDTVNTASRMESTSKKDQIHLSDKSAKLLQQFECASDVLLEARGAISVKGKGVMNTYWVRHASRPRSSSIS